MQRRVTTVVKGANVGCWSERCVKECNKRLDATTAALLLPLRRIFDVVVIVAMIVWKVISKTTNNGGCETD
jgi:hypothetical protein